KWFLSVISQLYSPAVQLGETNGDYAIVNFTGEGRFQALFCLMSSYSSLQICNEQFINSSEIENPHHFFTAVQFEFISCVRESLPFKYPITFRII
ncbi:hypothetical protein L3056_10975, partial [Corynebacterium sp. MC-25]|nr:hypothetical protein [Corynebacterium parakroppenstedtii]